MMFQFPYKRTHKKPTSNRFYREPFLLMILIAIFPHLTAAAQNESPPLTLKQAITLSLQQHPELKPFIHRKFEMEGDITQAKVGTFPKFDLALDDLLGSGKHSGFKNAQTTLSISWLQDKSLIKNKVNIAQHKSLSVEIEQQLTVLDIAAETAQLFIAILASKERFKQAEKAVAQTKSVYQIIKNRRKAGKSSNVDLLLAKNEWVKRKLVIEDLFHELQANHYLLSAQWSSSKPIQITGTLAHLPIIRDFADLEEKIK
ncbi:MAG: TolC family protein, partial [Methylococcales bacterium]|nr:TolC family protein [Methylococcales bacterium]